MTTGDDEDDEDDEPGGGPMSRRAAAWIAVVVFAAGALYLGLRAGESRGAETIATPEDEGALHIPAPDVEFDTPGDETASLADHRGEVVVLNFWGTWCPPCREELPHLVELHERIEPRGGVVIGVAVDSGTPEEVMAFARDYGVEYPIWLSGTQKTVSNFQVMGFPTTLIVDRDGVIRRKFLGPQTAEGLMSAVEPLL